MGVVGFRYRRLMVVAQLRRWRFQMAVLAGSWPDSRQWLSDGVGRGRMSRFVSENDKWSAKKANYTGA
ncbi:hypothetical protein P8452_51368 [Trifolium repens]|nr:hypothetical protein P8452_51368 [Trifolium repens]